MTDAQPARIDLDALAGGIADALQDPTYCVGDDGFARFETETVFTAAPPSAPGGVVTPEITVRAVVTMVSDGEDEIEGAAGEVIEIIVRRVSA